MSQDRFEGEESNDVICLSKKKLKHIEGFGCESVGIFLWCIHTRGVIFLLPVISNNEKRYYLLLVINNNEKRYYLLLVINNNFEE